MLERFRAAQAPSVERLKGLEQAGALPEPFCGARPSFSQAIIAKSPGALIAEYKRASPSQGDINLLARPEDVARAYAAAGAAAISVLTEQAWFKGDLSYLFLMAEAGLPLLRKDFLVHPLQVTETASTPASALLLIVRLLDDDTLTTLLKASLTSGLEAVIEVFDARDLARARDALESAPASPAMIQVNNRDLDTLRVNPEVSRSLVKNRLADEVWISASGVSGPGDVAERAALGFDAVLVGTALMAGGNPGPTLAGLHKGRFLP